MNKFFGLTLTGEMSGLDLICYDSNANKDKEEENPRTRSVISGHKG